MTDDDFLSALDSRGIACDPAAALEIKAVLEQPHPLDGLTPEFGSFMDMVEVDFTARGLWTEYDQGLRERITAYNLRKLKAGACPKALNCPCFNRHGDQISPCWDGIASPLPLSVEDAERLGIVGGIPQAADRVAQASSASEAMLKALKELRFYGVCYGLSEDAKAAIAALVAELGTHGVPGPDGSKP